MRFPTSHDHTTKKHISSSSSSNSIDSCRHSHYQAKQIPRLCVRSTLLTCFIYPNPPPLPPFVLFFACLLLDRTSFMYVFKRGGIEREGTLTLIESRGAYFPFGFFLLCSFSILSIVSISALQLPLLPVYPCLSCCTKVRQQTQATTQTKKCIYYISLSPDKRANSFLSFFLVLVLG